MKSTIHCYYIQNGMPVDRRYYLVSMSERAQEVYEVLRLIEGVPLFLEDHFLRMKRSARLVNKHLTWTLAEIEQNIRLLIEANRVISGNVKLLVQWEEDEKGELYTCFIPHRYPTPEEQREGVRVGTMKAERRNPNAKVTELEVRQAADQLMAEKDLYEVLLVSKTGEITEGSRSNFFGILGGRLITPPVEKVLPGITRQKVMDLAPSVGAAVDERPVSRDVPERLEAAFLTGTSPGVLPIRTIDNKIYRTEHVLLTEIAEAYHGMVREYIHSHDSVLVS